MGDDAMAAWCRRWLGAEPVEVVFRAGHLSQVTGFPCPRPLAGPAWLDRLAGEAAERAALAGIGVAPGPAQDPAAGQGTKLSDPA